MKYSLAFLVLSTQVLYAWLERYPHLVVADVLAAVPAGSEVRVTYLGTNGFQFESRNHALLVDPYFSRINLWRAVLGSPVRSDEHRIDDAMKRLARKVSATAWLLCLPVFLGSLWQAQGFLDPRLFWHLPISFGISAFIAITQTFFLVELASHAELFPIFFRDIRADLMPGVRTLSLRRRGVMWAISAAICPIASLVLLSFAPATSGHNSQWSAVFVGAVGIAFGLCSSIMISGLVARPIDQLRTAAQTAARGEFDFHLPVARADEFGLLIGEFNRMLRELKDKEKLRQTFGLHVGMRAAEQILARDPGSNGVEEEITVMFVDIRSATARAGASSPAEMIVLLNDFFRVTVRVVEEAHGGMVNKYLGDGFMAIFGTGELKSNHAEEAVTAGREILLAVDALNSDLVARSREPLRTGIGIHSGPAIVGSIGSPQRLEFTAIGNTVNIASRIEVLPKPWESRCSSLKRCATFCAINQVSKNCPCSKYAVFAVQF
jgi:adenylate cyclase